MIINPLKLTLAQAVQEFELDMVGIKTESTIKSYTYTTGWLIDFLGGDVPVDQITVRDLRRWRAAVAGRPGKSVYTLDRHIRSCRRFFNWCVEEGLVEKSPARRLAKPKLPRDEPKAITMPDLEKMLEVAKEDTPRNYAILRFLAETGCRVQGLTTLKMVDLNLAGCRALVREKGQKARRVQFGDITAEIIRAWLVERPNYLIGGPLRDYGSFRRADDALFLGRKGNMTGSGVYYILKTLAKAAGVSRNTNPHAFRHGLARRMLSNRADLGTVSRILGHSDIEVTHKYYAVWTEEELFERHKEFGGLLGEGVLQ